jgi:hypothetical protein
VLGQEGEVDLRVKADLLPKGLNDPLTHPAGGDDHNPFVRDIAPASQR